MNEAAFKQLVRSFGSQPWIFFRYPPITNNPWHPTIELTEQGRANVRRDLIENFGRDAGYKVPHDHGWTLFVDEEAVAGFVPA